MVKTIKHPFSGRPLEIKGDQKVGSFWTEARVIELVKMWADGVSSSRISKMMSQKYDHPVTRNAVIGRLSRMGLTSKTRQEEKKFRAKQKKKVTARARVREEEARKAMRHPRQMASWPGTTSAPHPPLVYEEVFREVIVPEAERVTLADLEDYQCRWPVGDPRESDFHFCGGRRMPNASYCVYHQAASIGIYDGVPAPWPTQQLKKKKKVLEPA
jgi:GcrA cell cycle regulator